MCNVTWPNANRPVLMTQCQNQLLLFYMVFQKVLYFGYRSKAIMLHNTYFFKKIHIFMPMNVELKFLLNIFIDYYFEHLAVQLKKGLNKCLWNWETEVPACLCQAKDAGGCDVNMTLTFVLWGQNQNGYKATNGYLEQHWKVQAKATGGIAARHGLVTYIEWALGWQASGSTARFLQSQQSVRWQSPKIILIKVTSSPLHPMFTEANECL